ncbi:hypothetical protein GS624_01140 [Ruegeria sp. HKCCD5849]|uniref:hypothetical protein n=1 Tax=unclassified Ruegeria TaxID=2625375 RepID=UPI001491FFAA|nr:MULTISPECIES: hypothetical protein [unclassified Ruegeria]NOD45909.1 hypothetical protein [Ruegeria sp. HKCCD5849]NOD50791.1 hypothetical protein [Ruegeria sp. HKCCD5851]
MPKNMPYDPAETEQKNHALQAQIAEYLVRLDGLRETIQGDLENPEDAFPAEMNFEFGEKLVLAHSAGNVFLHHLRQVSTASQIAR